MKVVSLFIALSLLSLAGCAHNRNAASTVSENRQEYISTTEQRLRDYDQKATKLKSDRAAQMRAEIADARAELTSLRSASNDRWVNTRTRVDERMIRIENTYKNAR